VEIKIPLIHLPKQHLFPRTLSLEYGNGLLPMPQYYKPLTFFPMVVILSQIPQTQIPYPELGRGYMKMSTLLPISAVKLKL
jgi:hypothetical protein